MNPITQTPPPDYLDCKKFVAVTSLSARTYWQLIKQGLLIPYRPSRRRTLVKWVDVERWLESYRADGTARRGKAPRILKTTSEHGGREGTEC
jgi:hypothetical protein